MNKYVIYYPTRDLYLNIQGEWVNKKVLKEADTFVTELEASQYIKYHIHPYLKDRVEVRLKIE